MVVRAVYITSLSRQMADEGWLTCHSWVVFQRNQQSATGKTVCPHINMDSLIWSVLVSSRVNKKGHKSVLQFLCERFPGVPRDSQTISSNPGARK